MDTLWSAVRLMTPECYMAFIDLKDAYYSVPITIEHRKFLRFCWREPYFSILVCQMGYHQPPRKQGHLNLGDIDDYHLQSRNYDECALNVSHTAGLLTELGFEISCEKSIMHSAQCVTFLGFMPDSVNMIIILTPKKKEKVKSVCTEMANEVTSRC